MLNKIINVPASYSDSTFCIQDFQVFLRFNILLSTYLLISCLFICSGLTVSKKPLAYGSA